MVNKIREQLSNISSFVIHLKNEYKLIICIYMFFIILLLFELYHFIFCLLGPCIVLIAVKIQMFEKRFDTIFSILERQHVINSNLLKPHYLEVKESIHKLRKEEHKIKNRKDH